MSIDFKDKVAIVTAVAFGFRKVTPRRNHARGT